ncbi:helix-turn-helix domain-containing protein [Stenotrophomonas sp. UBA7606]|uniref:helix-turn-helix domain-containing protein n=1 Tax=Stenotrophomonas sp. UBA7606 TaxID=1947559 RepID=UPI0025E688AE|nr:helix-turn-helix transcriptional regulator [Stenotrophomonas sp. UBA7606]
MKIDGKRIRQLREARGWSQEHLASICGLSPRTVQRLETEGNASHESRMAVAAALEVTAEDLLAHAPANNALAAIASPIAPGVRMENLALGLALLVMAVLYGAYNVGKDMALRDNAGCSATPAQCQR